MKKPQWAEQWTEDDRQASIFRGVALGGGAEKYGAGVNSDEAQDFLNALWQKFKATGIATPDVTWITESLPSEVEAWVDIELRSKFPAPNGRPVWIDTPDWRFHNGEPMLYLGCVVSDMRNTDETKSKRYVYLFEGKSRSDLGGHEVVYKMSIQDSNSVGSSHYG